MPLGRARPPRFPQDQTVQDFQHGALTIEQMANQSDRQQQDLYEKEIELSDEQKGREDQEYMQSLFVKYDGDMNAALTAVKGIRTGTVNINQVPGYRIECSPFGGVKDSGLGVKEGVIEAIKFMTNVKTFSMPW